MISNNGEFIMNKKTELFCCILGGWFGLHYFIKGHVKMGFIYLFTGGIFLIGWIIDIIKLLITIHKNEQLQNLHI